MEGNYLIQEMGIKDLEHVVLKAHDRSFLYGRHYEAGEPVLYFEHIQIAQLTENTRLIAAKGGFMNQPRVVWEDRENTMFQFSNGTLNTISLNMLLEANVVKNVNVNVPFKEVLTVENNKVYLTHEPAQNEKMFCYTYEVDNIQEKVFPKKIDPEKKILEFDEKYNDKDILVDYYIKPKSAATLYTMSRERNTNLYTLEATFYLKDENDGLLHTGLLEMPKVYIMSNINLRMGERADPTVGTFRIVAMPENTDGYDSMVYKVTYLDEDIYGI